MDSAPASMMFGTKYKDSAIPMFVLKTRLLPHLGMTGPVEDLPLGTPPVAGNFGISNETMLTVVMPSHPLAAGLTETVTVGTVPSPTTYAILSGGALSIATAVGKPTHSMIFAYPKGAAMPCGTAPAKRVGFFMKYDYTLGTIATAAGWRLFDAAVDWALLP
jgi:hypothetical protein